MLRSYDTFLLPCIYIMKQNNLNMNTYFEGERTSKQNLRSESVTGLTEQSRRSSSITVTESSPEQFMFNIVLNLYPINHQAVNLV